MTTSTIPNLDPTYQETIILGEVTSDPVQITDKNGNDITYYNCNVNHYYTHPKTKELKKFTNKFTCEIRGSVASEMAYNNILIGDLVLCVGNIGIDLNTKDENQNPIPRLLLKGRVQKIIPQQET